MIIKRISITITNMKQYEKSRNAVQHCVIRLEIV
jgi:hypothetical protein